MDPIPFTFEGAARASIAAGDGTRSRVNLASSRQRRPMFMDHVAVTITTL